ncbi:hypothetical protein Tco_1143501 [Tanacetum coccineum]
MVSPMCSDASESDTEIPERHVSPTTSFLEISIGNILPAPSAIVTPSSDFPLAPVVAPPGIHQRRAILIRPGVLRYTSHHLDRFTSGSSSSHSSSDHSSSGHSISGHSLSRHTPLDTTDADSSTPPRFVHPSLARTHGVARPISVGVPSHDDLPPPRKKFRDFISLEDSVEEDIDTDVLEDIEADATAVEVAVDMDVEVESSERGTMEVGVDMVSGIDIPDVMLMPDARIEDIKTRQRELESRSLIAGGERASLLKQVTSLDRSNARLRGTIMMERARADRFRRCVRFMESELRHIYRFCYYDRMRFRRLETFAMRRLVEEALLLMSNRAANALEAKSQRQNGSDGGNGNGGDGNGGNGNPNENNRDARPVARECTYQDFMKCQPLNFKGTKGVVRLIRWFEKRKQFQYQPIFQSIPTNALDSVRPSLDTGYSLDQKLFDLVLYNLGSDTKL